MKKYINKIDKPLFFIMIILLIAGVMIVGSASSLKAYMTNADSYHFLKKQLLFALAGMVGFFIIISKPIKKWKPIIFLGVFIVFALLIYVLLFSRVTKGINGWIYIGSFSFQPSEFAKTITILSLALIFEKLMRYNTQYPFIKLVPFVIPIIYIALIYKQPDLGTMVILLGITVVIFLTIPFEPKFKFITSSAGIILFLLVVVIMLASGKGLTDVQKNRLTFKDPCSRYREETGYQVCNGYIAINSGGILGTGFGDSKQKFLYLPEAHTDFIFAIIIEELGLVSGIFIFLLYFILIYRILKIGKKSYNLQGTIICYGVATYITLHIMVNLVGVLGLLPLTGVPLPFFSYGGSFLLNLIISLALVQRTAIDNKLFEQRHLI